MCNITISTQTHNGKTYKYFSVYSDGKRKLFKTKAKAEEFLKTLNATQEQFGKETRALFTKYGRDISIASDILKQAGLEPSALIDAAKEYAKRFVKTNGRKTLLETVRDYLNETKWDIGPSTYYSARQAFYLFAEQFEAETNPMSISISQIQQTMERLAVGRSNATFNSILRRLKRFAHWADQHEYPVSKDYFDKVSQKPIAAKEPRFITNDELRSLFEVAKKTEDVKNIMGLFALQFFAGIRTVEILALKPEDYHFDEENPYVRVSRAKGASRGRRGRVVPLEPAAAKILRKYFTNGETPTITKETVYKAYKCYDDAAIDNHHNIARHSFITYHIAKYGDENKTVTICGTSSDMAAIHYKGLATKPQAEEYFESDLV